MSLPIRGFMCMIAFSPSGIAKIEKNEQTRSPSMDFFCKIMKISVLNSLIIVFILSRFIFYMVFILILEQDVYNLFAKVKRNWDRRQRYGRKTCCSLLDLSAICIIIQNADGNITGQDEIKPTLIVSSRFSPYLCAK